MSHEDVTPESIYRYLNMIQRIIDRMSKNSFQIKAWSTTIFSGVVIFIFSYSFVNIFIFIILLITMFLFWTLDSFYLKKERIFRALYSKIVENFHDPTKRNNIKLYDLNTKKIRKGKKNLLKVMISTSEILYYSIILITTIVLLFIHILGFN